MMTHETPRLRLEQNTRNSHRFLPGESISDILHVEFRRLVGTLALSSQHSDAESAEQTPSQSESTTTHLPHPSRPAIIRRNTSTRYQGQRLNGKCTVVAYEEHARRSLPKHTGIVNHSRGFEWGYCGSGPAQLAVAILADVLDDDDLVRKYYQQFKTDVVAHFENSGWTLTDDEVIDWLRRRHDGHVEVLHR